jgi:uncharacterized UBP type Zn finger protein
MQILMHLGVIPDFLENSLDKASFHYNAIKTFVQSWDSTANRESFYPESIVDMNIFKESGNLKQQDPSEFIGFLIDIMGIRFDIKVQLESVCSQSSRHILSVKLEYEPLSVATTQDGGLSLQQLLSLHIQPETRHDFLCSQCQCASILYRTFMETPPTVLQLEIKRFQWTSEKKTRSGRATAKPVGVDVTGKVEIDTEITVSINFETVVYSLEAVILRCGSKNTAGHNISIKKLYDDKWALMNDKKTSYIKTQNALLLAGTDGVLFFYKKKCDLSEHEQPTYTNFKVAKTLLLFLLSVRINEI